MYCVEAAISLPRPMLDINIPGNQTKVQCIYAGGFAHPAQKTPVTVWNDAVCGTKDVKITISEGVEFPEGLGCGGGQRYAYTVIPHPICLGKTIYIGRNSTVNPIAAAIRYRVETVGTVNPLSILGIYPLSAPMR